MSSASLSSNCITKLRDYLDTKTTERLIHAFVSSKYDYCNSLLYAQSRCEISRFF